MAIRTFLILAVLTLMAPIAPAFAQTTAPNPPPAAAPTQPAQTTEPAQPATPAATPMTAAQSAQAVAGAKALMLKIIHTNPISLPPASVFTNRSAALTGVIMFIPLAMFEAFASMGTGKEKAKAKKIELAMDALGKKYQVDSNAKTPAQQKAAMAKLETRGRLFYTDVLATFNQVMKDLPDSKSKASPDDSPSSQFPRNIDAYTFTPVSPTVVKIITKNQKMPIEAKLENGLWRLDYGGLADLNKWMPNAKVSGSPSADSSSSDDSSSDATPQMKAAESTFSQRASSSDTQNGSEVLSFSDNYQWAVDDDILVSRDGVTDKGRKMEVWLGKKADYFHILKTNLVAIRTHDKNYPRQDTFSDAIQGGDTERVQELMAANPKLVNIMMDMDTPLQRAVFYDQKEIVQLLLSHGAKVNGTDDFGQTPLMDSALFDKPDMAKLLLAAGANVNLKNNNGETALSIAKKGHYADILAILKQHGAH